MHRLHSAMPVLPSRLSAVWSGLRCLHRHRSPDRTFSERIQDQQNTFQWSDKHVFRPHQHFSYDPTSWSRPLEEKAKAQRTLSLVERVKLAQEHEQERQGNLHALQHAAAEETVMDAAVIADARETSVDAGEDAGKNDDMPAYFFSLTDTRPPASTTATLDKTNSSSDAWAKIPLQDLLDEVQRLHRLLYSHRYARNSSLARRARQQEEFHTTLLELFKRASNATLGVSMTVDAALCAWFNLVSQMEPLVEALVAVARGDAVAEKSVGGEEEVEEVLRRVFSCLHSTVLSLMRDGELIQEAATAGALSLEALVELLYLSTSPFVRQCCAAFQAPAPLPPPTISFYVRLVTASAHARACETVSTTSSDANADGANLTALREWVDPTHLKAWAVALKQLSHAPPEAAEDTAVVVVAALPGLLLHLTHAAMYLTKSLETVTALSTRGSIKASLRRAHFAQASGDASTKRPKAVVLDATVAPHGVQTPPTEAEDVVFVLAACAHLLQTLMQRGSPDESTTAGGVTEESVRRLVAACLGLSTHAPNFDLDAQVVVPWACALLESGVLVPDVKGTENGSSAASVLRVDEHLESTARLSLRFLLVLSRLPFSEVADRPMLGRLVLLLCQWPAPECRVDGTAAFSPKERAEWRRLRGLVMKAAFDTVTCDHLHAAASTVADVSSWVESVAFGEYDGILPLPLWRAACQQWLPVPPTPTPSKLRFTLSSTTSASPCPPEVARALLHLCARYVALEETGKASVANVHTPQTAQCVAQCLALCLGQRELAEQLLSSPGAWAGVSAATEASLHPLLAAMRDVVRREKLMTKKVVVF